MSIDLRDLKSEIAEGKILALTGAGVSAAITNGNEYSTWRGLLEAGINHTVQYCPVSIEWVERQKAALATDDVVDWIGVAQQIETRLSQRGEFTAFINHSIRQLKIVDPTLGIAIGALNAPIATTNYDTLTEEALGISSIVWDESPHIGDWLAEKFDRRPVLHLHGIWRRPPSVVFGYSSYSRLLSDKWAQFIQKVIATTSSILFIGCGKGNEDPNLASLIEWLAQDAPKSARRHYRLCRASERELLLRAPGNIQPIVYGDHYSQLADFIRTELTHPVRAIPAEIVRLAQGHDYLRKDAGTKWEERNIIFESMVNLFKVNAVALSALEMGGFNGITVTALLARAKAHPSAKDLAYLFRIARQQPPVERDAHYKIADVLGAMVESGEKFEKQEIDQIAQMLGSFRPISTELAVAHHLRFDKHIEFITNRVRAAAA